MLVISIHRLRPREEVEAGIQAWVALPGDVPSTQLGLGRVQITFGAQVFVSVFVKELL